MPKLFSKNRFLGIKVGKSLQPFVAPLIVTTGVATLNPVLASVGVSTTLVPVVATSVSSVAASALTGGHSKDVLPALAMGAIQGSVPIIGNSILTSTATTLMSEKKITPKALLPVVLGTRLPKSLKTRDLLRYIGDESLICLEGQIQDVLVAYSSALGESLANLKDAKNLEEADLTAHEELIKSAEEQSQHGQKILDESKDAPTLKESEKYVVSFRELSREHRMKWHQFCDENEKRFPGFKNGEIVISKSGLEAGLSHSTSLGVIENRISHTGPDISIGTEKDRFGMKPTSEVFARGVTFYHETNIKPIREQNGLILEHQLGTVETIRNPCFVQQVVSEVQSGGSFVQRTENHVNGDCVAAATLVVGTAVVSPPLVRAALPLAEIMVTTPKLIAE